METHSILSNKEVMEEKNFPSSNKIKESFIAFTTYFFIMLFTYTSLRVLLDYKMFVREVYGLIVWSPVKWGFAVICIGEIFAVICLVIPKFRYAGYIMTFLMMSVVNVATFIVLQKAPLIPSFFGAIFPTVDFWGHLYINLAVLSLALIGLIVFIDVKKQPIIHHKT